MKVTGCSSTLEEELEATSTKVTLNFFPYNPFVCAVGNNANLSGNFLSLIKACFNLGGHFDESNYIAWTGHKGKVRIEKSKAGFVNVVQFYKADLTPQEEANL